MLIMARYQAVDTSVAPGPSLPLLAVSSFPSTAHHYTSSYNYHALLIYIIQEHRHRINIAFRHHCNLSYYCFLKKNPFQSLLHLHSSQLIYVFLEIITKPKEVGHIIPSVWRRGCQRSTQPLQLKMHGGGGEGRRGYRIVFTKPGAEIHKNSCSSS